MIGRAAECAQIDGLVAAARRGRSGTLVLTGQPGVGKSTLCEYAVDHARGMRVLKATGVETEVNVAFAGLDQVVRPVLPLADRLPSRQAEVLKGALGVIDQVSHDRFLLGAATLSLLSEAAEDGPVLCVIEDAHWLDQSSAETLAFAARRLEAEGIALIVATRDEPWPGLPTLPISGLKEDESDELLRQTAGMIAAHVAHQLFLATDGNPLALVELAASIPAEQLAGDKPLAQPLPLSARVQELFLPRLRQLPRPTQTLLLVAAADDSADPGVVFRAAFMLGVHRDALDPAEQSGLARVEPDGRFTFRHPLVRACVYQAARFTERMAVHRALARALDSDAHATRRAWHLAITALAPDEAVAQSLEHAADAARQRGGYAVAAQAYERAVDLAPRRSDRARLAVGAAQAAFFAGHVDRAARLAEQAEGLVEDPVSADELTLLKGRIEFARGSAVRAHALLIRAAQNMARRDPRGAAAVLLEAARAAWNAHDQTRHEQALEVLGRLELPAGDAIEPVVSMAIGFGAFATGRPSDGVTQIRRATAEWMRWLRKVGGDLATDFDGALVEASLAMAGVTRISGDDSAGLSLGAAIVTACRQRGLGAWLWALVNLAMTEVVAGRHSAATASGTEGLRLARDLRHPTAICYCAAHLAWLAAVRGEEARCRELAAEAVQLAETHQLAVIAAIATWSLGLLELTLGRPEAALDRMLDRAYGPPAVPTVMCLVVPDIVEAAARAARLDEVRDMVAWYSDWARATEQPWAQAAVRRCMALLSDDEAEAHLVAAVGLHEQAGADHRPFDRARTQLLYGQWLRRARRRVDARVQLAAALETFHRLGTGPWAERARVELRATGQRVPRPNPGASRLTPQEMQVIRLVAIGGSNHEVAAEMFLSPRTVAYHLYKAFPKLGITSRAELARLDLDELIATLE